MPALWTHLPRININHPATRTRPYLAWLRRVLSLSGSLPIHIRVGLMKGKATGKRTSQASHPAFKILKNYSHRWASATLHVPPIFMSNLGRDARSFPILNELEVEGFCEQKWTARRPRLDSIPAVVHALNAPPLKAISFSGKMVFYEDGESLALPLLQWWAKGSSNTNIFCNLRELRLSIDRFHIDTTIGPSATETLTLASLESLCVRPPYGSHGRQSLIDRLRLPALKHVTLEDDLFYTMEDHMERLFLLLDRSGTLRNLESLKVFTSPYEFKCRPLVGGWPSAALLRILDANDCLEHLELVMLDYANFFAALPPFSECPALPSLKILVLGDSEDFDPTAVNTVAGSLLIPGGNCPRLETEC